MLSIGLLFSSNDFNLSNSFSLNLCSLKFSLCCFIFCSRSNFSSHSLILINSSNYHEYWNIAGYTGFSGVSLVDSTQFGIDFQITSSSNRGRSYGQAAMVNHGTVATSAEL